jgi:hypothetical protein
MREQNCAVNATESLLALACGNNLEFSSQRRL